MVDGILVKFAFNTDLFLNMLADEIEKELKDYPEKMKDLVDTAVGVPQVWKENTKGMIDIRSEVAGSSIHFELGLVKLGAWHLLMQAYVMNKGSTVISVAGQYLNIHTGGVEDGAGMRGGQVGVHYPTWDKEGVGWFDNVEAEVLGRLATHIDLAVNRAIGRIKSSEGIILEGKTVDIKLNI